MLEYEAAYMDMSGVEAFDGVRDELIADISYMDEEINKRYIPHYLSIFFPAVASISLIRNNIMQK